MRTKTVDGNVMDHATPPVHQHAAETQPYGHLVRLPIGLSEKAFSESVGHLNQLLADTVTLRDLYKKHHWQADIAEATAIPRPPEGREDAPAEIARLLHAHEVVLKEARSMASLAAERGDEGTNDLIVSDVIRTNEMQVWFLAEHVADRPVHAG